MEPQVLRFLRWIRTKLDGSQDSYLPDGLLEAGNDRPGGRHLPTDEGNNTYKLQLTQDTWY